VASDERMIKMMIFILFPELICFSFFFAAHFASFIARIERNGEHSRFDFTHSPTSHLAAISSLDKFADFMFLSTRPYQYILRLH